MNLIKFRYLESSFFFECSTTSVLLRLIFRIPKLKTDSDFTVTHLSILLNSDKFRNNSIIICTERNVVQSIYVEFIFIKLAMRMFVNYKVGQQVGTSMDGLLIRDCQLASKYEVQVEAPLSRKCLFTLLLKASST